MDQLITTNNTIGAFAAKTHLSAILEKVQAGQVFTITKNGKAVAEIKSVQSNSAKAHTALAMARKIRESVVGTVTREEIKEMINYGRP
ncbi:MAG: type II toxin-antitoxin system prevent-host-death family antitoxin [Patescibacteria group bacterium]|jgi:prevent-host-death family protein